MTGATDDQIEAAHRRKWDEKRAKQPWLVPFDDLDEWSPHRHCFDDAVSYFIRPGTIIVPATALPSPSVLAAMTRAVTFIEAFNSVDSMEDASLATYYATFVTADDVATMRAYLAAIEGDGT